MNSRIKNLSHLFGLVRDKVIEGRVHNFKVNIGDTFYSKIFAVIF